MFKPTCPCNPPATGKAKAMKARDLVQQRQHETMQILAEAL
jgi:hypothetical protein